MSLPIRILSQSEDRIIVELPTGARLDLPKNVMDEGSLVTQGDATLLLVPHGGEGAATSRLAREIVNAMLGAGAT